MRFNFGLWSIGSLIAAAVSYSVNKNIGMAILNGIASWFYLALHFWK